HTRFSRDWSSDMCSSDLIIRDTEKLEQEIVQTSEALKEITGFSPTLFRPVGGSYNKHIINTAAENGHHVVLWSWHQDTKDWRNRSEERRVGKESRYGWEL